MYIKHFPWIYGRPAQIWIRYQDVIKDLVKKNKLRPLDKAYHIDMFSGTPVPYGGTFDQISIERIKEAKPLPFPWPWPCPGGIRGPHFHLGEEIFMVDPKTWKEFAGGVIAEGRKLIDGANALKFESILEIGEITESMRY